MTEKYIPQSRYKRHGDSVHTRVKGIFNHALRWSHVGTSASDRTIMKLIYVQRVNKNVYSK